MEHREILDFIDNNIIYGRGMNYYRMRRVVRFDKEDNKITAEVRGSKRNPYNVRIQLNNHGEPISAKCNCPYAEGFYKCKHIAAVLIYNCEENKVLENPIINEKDRFNENVIMKLDTVGEQLHRFDYVKYIENTLKKEDSDSQKGFKLAFVIEHSKIYRKNWIIFPVLQYIKRSGERGRFEKFNEGKFCESTLTENENILLQKLKNRNEKKDALMNHIGFLLKTPLPSLYLKKDQKYLLIAFEEIEKINVRFKLDKIENNLIYFRAMIDMVGKSGKCGEWLDCFSHTTYDNDKWIVYDGITVLIISKDGIIFYKENHKLYWALFQAIFEKGDNFTYYDIEKLKNYFQANYTDEINIIFNTTCVKISSPVPKTFIEAEYKHRFVDDYLEMKLFFDYNGKEVIFESPGDLISLDEENNEYIIAKRNREYEKKIFNFLSHRFKSFKNTKHSYFYDSFGSPKSFTLNMPLVEFLAKYGSEIIDEGIAIRIKGQKHKIFKQSGRISIKVDSGIDWFDIHLGYTDSQGKENNVTLDISLLKDGLLGVGDTFAIITKEDIKKLQLLLDEGMTPKGKLSISKYNFHIIDEIYEDIKNKQLPEIQVVKKLSAQLKNFDKIEDYPLPEKFNGALRHYQCAGYKWLHFLNKYNINGCLADDMGLGKTVQVLALLQRLKEENRLKSSLIVVPVTTLSNWEIEINKFTPGLKYLLYFGQSRKKDIEHLKNYDIVIASYHTVRNDIELFNKTNYDYIVLDESQNIKNYESLIFKAIRVLKSDYKLSLTGTPIENNTLELWAQMDALNPGLLGSPAEFKRKFTKPIEFYKDKSAAEILKRKIFPFLLRRRKEDVLKELPPKSEILLYSEMEEEQSRLYEQLREYYKAQISGKIEKEGLENSAIEIFAALLRLRQVALLPLLVDKKYTSIPSCKFGQLKNIVEEILEEGHKILIFSQFIGSLKIIEHYVKDKRFRYSYIDGSVTAEKRKTEIKNFQENEEVKLFLLSLRAGGIGINLTAADYVILFDPWWNPAVETQAIDRAHRIGQTKKVIVYKMIVKNTVEEKILELQEKKKNLVKELITTESTFFKSLTKADIINLFQ